MVAKSLNPLELCLKIYESIGLCSKDDQDVKSRRHRMLGRSVFVFVALSWSFGLLSGAIAFEKTNQTTMNIVCFLVVLLVTIKTWNNAMRYCKF